MTTYTLHHGDCLDILPTLEANSVDAVVTDPPYMINTKSDGNGKLSPWADRVNAASWYRQWMEETRRILRPSGCLWSFLNWRSFVTFQKATDDMRWSIESIMIWDKDWIGPGGPKGLRPSYELVALWAMPEFSIENRSVYDIQKFPWSSQKPNGHPAEKPQSLVEFLINISTDSGAVILDPFMGSGTTGAACVQSSRQFIGVELDPYWIDYAEQRIRNAAGDYVLTDKEQATGQLPLWEVKP